MQVSIRVLGIREEDAWCAIALEMSLRGYGKTFQETLADLTDAIEAQVSFALQHDTLSNIWVPAEPQYVELYNQTRRRYIPDYLRCPDELEKLEEQGEYAPPTCRFHARIQMDLKP